MSNWYESDLSVRKSVVIFLEKVKKPLTVTAGGFVTLSLTTLTGVRFGDLEIQCKYCNFADFEIFLLLFCCSSTFV